jgi:hypothetical protein
VTGGVTTLRAIPSLRGSRIELTWRNPPTDALGGGWKLAGIRILRRERTYPRPAENPATMPADGTLVYPSPSAAYGPVITSFSDIGLEPLTTYYYSVYAVFEDIALSTTRRFLADVQSNAAGFATKDYHLADRLYGLLPAVHQRLDRPLTAAEVDRLRMMNPDAALALNALPPLERERGQLRRFVGSVGTSVDLMRSLAEGLRQLHDTDIARADFLPAAASWLGWEPDRTIPVFEQRNEIKFAPYRYRTVGTVPNIRSIVTRYGRWYPQVAEFAEQIARSTVAAQLNTFWIAQGGETWHGGDDAAPVLGLVGANSTATGSSIPPPATPARLTSAPGPFALRHGMELAVTADERIPVVVRFGADDFSNIAQATASEVAAVLNRTLSEITASVTPAPGSRVVISSNTAGTTSSLRVERYDASLVTLESAPRGRLVPVIDAAAAPLLDRVRLFYETADPETPARTAAASQALNGPPFPRRPLAGERLEPPVDDPGKLLPKVLPALPQGRIHYKTFRGGTWGPSHQLFDAMAPAHGEPAAVRLTGPDRVWVAWIENPNTAASRLRFRVGTPRPARPARLVSRRGEPFFIRPGTRLVLRSRRPAAGFEFRTTDFAQPPGADGTQRASAAEVQLALNNRLAPLGFVSSAAVSGAIAIATVNAGGDEWLAVDLANSPAASALGLDGGAIAHGDWGDEIDWSAPEDVPVATAPGHYSEPSAVVISAVGPGPETVFLCWARHDGAQWIVEASVATPAGTTWSWSAVEIVANSGDGDREPCAALGAAPAAVRVFWSHREIRNRTVGEDCWTLRCSDRVAGTWSPPTPLTTLTTTTMPAQRDLFADREPGVVRMLSGYRVFFRTSRGGGANVFAVDVSAASSPVSSLPGRVVSGAPNDHWPAPIFWPATPPAKTPQLRLLFRSDRSVPLSRLATQAPPVVENRVTSPLRPPALLPAPQRSNRMPDTGTEHRFCGATSVNLTDAARIARHQEWDDLLTYTPERPERHQSPETALTGKPGSADFKLADDIRYTRGTIGLFLSPFAQQDPQFEDFRERLRPLLDRFLPINARAIVRLGPRVFTEFVYSPVDIAEETFFSTISPFVETYLPPAEANVAPLPWGILHAADLSNVDDPIPIDLSADPADLTTLRRRTFFHQADEEAFMRKTEFATTELHGMYRDVVRDAAGNVIADSLWKKNLILDGFRRVLASFAHGVNPPPLAPGTPPSIALGIEEVRFGRGDPAWDAAGLPTLVSSRDRLEDTTLPLPIGGLIAVPRFLPPPPNNPNPDFQIRFLANSAASPTETNVVEIVATLPPGPAMTLREFGVVGKLDGNPVLLNYVAHQAIVKDPTTTLTRTIRFVF